MKEISIEKNTIEMRNNRYKELLYQGKTYTKKYQIDEILIENGFNWFIDAEIENVRIEIQKDTLILNAGIIYNCVWEYGVIRDGDVRNITFQNGVIYNGVFKKFTIKKGIIFGGTFLRGDILYSDIRGGEFKDVNISTNVNQTEKTQQPETQTQTQVQGEPTIQTQGEVQGQTGQEIQSQVEEKYNPRVMKYGKFINELFLGGKPNENDKLALALVNKFLEEFKTKKDLKMCQERSFEYNFIFSNGDSITFDPTQFKKLSGKTQYIIKYNFDDIEISQNAYNKIKEICKHINKIKKELIQKKDYEELVKIVGKDIKKYVDDKFQFFYNIEKKDPWYVFFGLSDTVVGQAIYCNFGSIGSVSPHEKYYNDISSIHIHSNNTVTFSYSYPRFSQYKSFTIPADWTTSIISKWRPKIAEIVKIRKDKEEQRKKEKEELRKQRIEDAKKKYL